MTQPKPSPIVRLLPSLTDAAFIMPLVFLFARMNGATTLLSDGDTGWHIRTGDWILQNGRVPQTDMFSYTKPGQPWFAWEWLWDVIFAWLHQHWGLSAVVFLSMLVICATSALLFRLVRRKCGNDVIAIGVTFVAVAGGSMHWLARPHLFTLLFVVIFYSILERVQEGRTRLLWALPALTILWTNLHGGFIAGIILILAYAAGELAAGLVEADQARRRTALSRSVPYLAAAAASAAASLLNPYGYHLHAHIAAYLNDPYHFQHIAEFLSFDFQHPVSTYVELMLLLGAAGAFLNAARRDFVYPVLFIFWARAALYSVRNIPLLMIIAAPFAAAALAELLTALGRARIAAWLAKAAAGFENAVREFGAVDRLGRVYAPSVAAAALLGLALHAAPSDSKFNADYDHKKYPARALEVLRGPEFAAGVFTTDEWGDYLIYRLYPAVRVYMDGRSDFYGAKFGEDYGNIMAVRHTWEKKLHAQHVHAVLLPVDTALAGAMKESTRWRAVYDDGVAIVFRSVPAGAGMASPTSIVTNDSGSGARPTARPATLTQTQPDSCRRKPS